MFSLEEQALQLHATEHINPLPVVGETAWEKLQKPELRNPISSFNEHQNFTLLTLYDKATALQIEGLVLGSTCSHLKSKSLLMAVHTKHSDEVNLDIKSICYTSHQGQWKHQQLYLGFLCQFLL